MKTLLKLLLWLLLGLFALLAVAAIGIWYYFDGARIASMVQTPISEMARAAGISTVFDEGTLGLSGYRAKRIGLTLPAGKVGIPLELTDVSLIPSLVSTSNREISLKGAAGLYRGQLTGDVFLSGAKSELSGQMNLLSARLDEHPLLQLAGVTHGTVSGSIRNARFRDGRADSGEIELQIRALERKAGIAGILQSAAPMLQLVPAFVIDSAMARGVLSNQSIAFPEINVRSSLGQADGGGEIRAMNGEEALSLRFAVTLSAEGSRQFGPLLEMASKGAVRSGTETFVVEIHGTTQRPIVTYRKDTGA